MEFHEVASIFPMMSAEEYQALKTDIAEHGLREPIWTWQGKVVDGRNRYNACADLGIAPRCQEWDGQGSLVAFVVSLNLKRRHLDASQRSMVAARIATLERGRPEVNVEISTFTQPEAAKLLNVSRESVIDARKVLAAGAPSLQQAVSEGGVAVSTAAVIAELPEQEQAELVARGEKEIIETAKRLMSEKREARREERIDRLVEIARQNRPLNGLGKYNVIYADPPWRYEHSVSTSRDIENQYPTMDLDEICALPVQEISAEDCVLFLWATSPKLYEAMHVLTEWGFSYRTCFVWVKDKIGMGYYARQQHELLLVAAKGELPTPRPEDRPASVVYADRTDHSRKPPQFYTIIEQMYPDFGKIELFSRGGMTTWDQWGNQASTISESN